MATKSHRTPKQAAPALKFRPTRLLFGFLIVIAHVGAAGQAARFDPRAAARNVAAVFQPYHTEHAALARDGRHVAFSGAGMKVTVFDVQTWARTEHGLTDRPGARIQTLAWSDRDCLLAISDTPVFFVIDRRTGLISRVLDAASFVARGTQG